MKTLEKATDLQAEIRPLKMSGKRVGFVPTMGALHAGHLSLIAEARKNCDVVICSIFVNPTQFNDPKDFERYPRNDRKDAEMLAAAGCDFLYLPSVSDVYPDETYKIQIDFGYLETVLEGAHRPGHFKGVGMVVKRFFELVEPDVAFFGLKDFQQFLIIKSLVKQFRLPVELRGMPTVREKDGLAMSSRNQLLSEPERKVALKIVEVLRQIKTDYPKRDLAALKEEAQQLFAQSPDIKLDYFEIANADDLKMPADKSEIPSPVALVAAFVGKVRLIDNMELTNV